MAVGKKWRTNIRSTMMKKVKSGHDFSRNQVDMGTERSPIFIDRVGLRVNKTSINVKIIVISSSSGTRMANTPMVVARPLPPVNFR